MHLIVYTSNYKGNKADLQKDLKSIINVSKKNNSQHEVCGVLLIHESRFLQVLEGERDALYELMKKIEVDDRHGDVDILVNQSVENRSFKDWNMDVFDLSHKAGLNNESLKIITQIYKENFSLNGKVLAEFYKEMTRHIGDIKDLDK